MTITRAAISACALAALASTMSVTARMQAPAAFDESLLRAFTYRNLGPYRMGARTSDIASRTTECRGTAVMRRSERRRSARSRTRVSRTRPRQLVQGASARTVTRPALRPATTGPLQ